MDTNYGFRKTLKSGEWACTGVKCSYLNPENAQYCESCGAEKTQKRKYIPEVGKDGAEKSKGLFSADDWMCTKCGNVNWARRQICNMCNSRRNADAEQRTGYGGGFMDRQEVEYKEKTGDHDEDFDEFGRKKRKTSGNGKLPEKKPRYDEDEQDEDDDTNLDKYKLMSDEDDDNEIDDDELAKYDLTADPEVVENKDKVILKFERARSPSPQSSDCSCSCSGGECSCPEEEEPPKSSRDRDYRNRDYDSHDRHRHRDDRHYSRSHQRSSSRDDRDDRKRSDRDRDRHRR